MIRQHPFELDWKIRTHHATLVGCASLALLPSSAFAQEAEIEMEASAKGFSGNTIIVTATKRDQSIQDIPFSISALPADALQRAGTDSFDEYATAIPNLSFGYSGSGRQTARNFQIRGITGSDTSALYIGETQVPTSIDPRVIDIQRVEVLRGPQGSLFGARSMGGLVRLIPSTPDTSETQIKTHTSIGGVNEGGTDFAADATVNVAVNDRLAIRATGYYLREAGFIDRLIDPDLSLVRAGGPMTQSGDETLNENINDTQTYGGILSLRYEITPDVTITPWIMHQRTTSGGPNFVDDDVNNLTKIRQFDVDERGRDKWTLAAFELEADVGIGTIFSSTSYFDRETFDLEDSTTLWQGTLIGPSILFPVDESSVTTNVTEDRRITQEVRFASDLGGAFDFIIGGFYQDVKRAGIFPPESLVPAGFFLAGVDFGNGALNVGDSFFSLDQRTRQKEWGIFGEGYLKVTPELTLTLGGRYYRVETDITREDGGALYPVFFGIEPLSFQETQIDKGFNPRAAITWEPTPEFTLYANVAQGFRPGTANLGAEVCRNSGFPEAPNSVQSDSLWNYEIGMKNQLFNDRVSTSLSVFKIVWDDRRSTVQGNCGLGFGFADNVGQAQSEGFEFEINIDATDWLQLNGGVGYVDSRITDNGGVANITEGQRLFDVPRWTTAFAADVSKEVGDFEPYGRVDFRYVGPSTSPQRNLRPEYELVNARIGVRYQAYDISLFVTNLFDERANLSDPVELSDGFNFIAINRPRTFGVDLRTNF